MEMAKAWRIELFGGLRAGCGPQVITRFRTQKIGALLAYLAYHRQRAHPREVLLEVLWPEAEMTAGRNNLRVALVSLRHQLEPPGIAAGSVLLADRASVGLNAPAITTDVMEFETALQKAAARHASPERVELWEQAVLLYRGPLLAGFYENWIPVEEQRLEELFFRATHQLIETLEQNRQLERALHFAQHAVTVAPLREEARRELMRLYVALGELPAALRQYHDFEQLLDKQWGEVPSAATRALAYSISQQAGKSGDWKTPGSQRRVKGAAAKSKTVASLTPPIEIAPSLAPPRHHNLPRQLNRCFGRIEARAQVCALLQSPGTRLVTLTGAGGSGKTRLSLEVLWHLIEPETKGAMSDQPVSADQAEINLSNPVDWCAWFVPLADVGEPPLILDAILNAIPVARSAQSEPLEQVVAALSPSSLAPSSVSGVSGAAIGLPCEARLPLLLLDNFEQLMPDGAAVIRLLLERVPSLKCLVTSRHRLMLPGEREYLVAPLPIPDMSDVPQQLVQNASVQLLIDRAQTVRADFQVTRTNAAAVAKLCRRLDGIPLALELAAARAHTLTIAQMLAQLEQRLDFTGSSRYQAAPRHQTLRAAIEWSYLLLSPGLQNFFARLGIFRGGWAQQAATAICEEDKAPSVGATLDYLTQLRNCSLVLTQEGRLEMRFQMMETLREYAIEQVAPNEQAVLARRHATYFVEIAESIRSLNGAEAKARLDTLETEHDNLRAALAWAVEYDEIIGLRLVSALGHFWHVRGYAHEGRLWAERVLAVNEVETNEVETNEVKINAASASQAATGQAATGDAVQLNIWRAEVMSWAGTLAWGQGDFVPGQALMEKGLELQRICQNPRGMALALNNLGSVRRDQGDFAPARACFEEALTLLRELNFKPGMAAALFGLGTVACNEGHYDEARAAHEASLTLHRELDNKRGIALVLNNLGVVVRHQNDYETAYQLHQEALGLQQEIGDKAGLGYTLVDLGNVSQLRGDYDAAHEFYQQSLTLRHELGHKAGSAHILVNLAALAESQKELSLARKLYGQSLRAFQELQEKDSIICCLEALARLEVQQTMTKPAKNAARLAHLGHAALLWSATQAWRSAINFPLPPDEKPAYESHLALTRTGLGSEKFGAAWATGQTLTIADAVACALEKLSS